MHVASDYKLGNTETLVIVLFYPIVIWFHWIKRWDLNQVTPKL